VARSSQSVVIDSPVFILAKEMLVPFYLPPTSTQLSLVETTVHVNNAELQTGDT